jgi:hypothetical protein
MKIDTVVNVGQKIWAVMYCGGRKQRPCGFCGAQGRITGKDGTSLDCPFCDNGNLGKDQDAFYEVVWVGYVSSISFFKSKSMRLRFVADRGDLGHGHDFDILAPGEEQSFCTIERYAQAVCDKLNAAGAKYPQSGCIGRLCDDL